MEAKGFDWKDVTKDITEAAFEQIKDNAAEYLEEAIVPELEKQKEAFVAELKEEAKETKSVWVKVRNSMLSILVNAISEVMIKIITKAIEENKKEE